MVFYRKDCVMLKFFEFYKFVIDGFGGGKWLIEILLNLDFFWMVYLIELVVFVVMDEIVFIFGGLVGEWIDLIVGWGRIEIVIGVLVFNMKIKIFEKFGYEEILVGVVVEYIL